MYCGGGHRPARAGAATRLLIAAALAWSAATAGLAATIEYDIQPRLLRLGESATCRITIRGASGAPAPSLPPISGFDISSTGTEQSFSVSPNGRESSVAYVYRLTPREIGTFVIGPFSYSLHGDTVSLPAVEIKVLAPGAGDSASPAQRMSDLLFATLSIDQPHVYVQQSFAMLLSIFSQGLNLDREVQLTDFKTAGLKIEGYDEMGATREVVNGQPYDVRRFRVRATALTAGTFSLSPRLRVNAVVPTQRRRDPIESFFGDAFFSRAQVQPLDVAAQPLDLTVKDLPVEGRPASFSGAVGRYSFDVAARPLQLRVGDPVTITLTIRGQGNLAGITPPALALGDAFKVYEPRLITDDPANGQRVFEQVVIPRTAKATDLPAISFSFFDPQMEAYQTISHGPYTLALDATGATDPMMLQGAGHPAISVPASLGSDIVYLKSAPHHWARHTDRSWYESPVVWSLQGVAPVALALLFLVARRRDAMASDTARARRHHAPRSARLAMAEAEQQRVAGSRQEFFEGLWKVLTTYFGHRFNLAPGEVAAEEVSRRLQRAGLPVPEVVEIRQLFTDCESHRFGSGESAASALSESERQVWQLRLNRLSQLLRQCERLRL
jgi:hypothetical protein